MHNYEVIISNGKSRLCFTSTPVSFKWREAQCNKRWTVNHVGKGIRQEAEPAPCRHRRTV